MEELTAETFQDKVLKETRIPVLVDFYTTWCPPCKILKPILEQVSEQFKDKMNFYCCDIEKNETIADQFDISSIPTLTIFKNGTVFKQEVGAMSKQNLIKWLSDI